MARSLILISSLPADAQFAAQAAATAGLALRTVKNPADAVKLIAVEEGCVLLVDASTQELYAQFERSVQDTLGLFSSRLSANHIHYLSSAGIYEVPYLIQSPLFGSYIHRNFELDPHVGQHYGRLLAATVHDKAFGTEKLVKPGSRIQTIQLKMALQKQEAVEAVRNYLIALKFQSRMATVIANAVDEILMNAIFDAPVDQMGKSIYDSTSRATNFLLEGQRAVELHVGYDGQYVTLTAVDQYGSLDKNRLLAAISKIYTEQEYKVRSSVAGAGIGLASVFHSGGSFLFSSEQGSRTEVTVFFRRCESYREFKSQFRFLSTQFYF
ncbi:MAG: hypothetical protein ACK5QT_00415 [Oligoflexia bacterium]